MSKEKIVMGLVTAEQMLKENPKKLIDMINNDMITDGCLTHITELAGNRLPYGEIVEPLGLLFGRSKSPIVREGCLLGLIYHLDSEYVYNLFYLAMREDTSPGIRQVAKESIEDDPRYKEE